MLGLILSLLALTGLAAAVVLVAVLLPGLWLLAVVLGAVLGLVSLVLYIFGLVLAFRARWWIGLVSIFIQPIPTIFALCKIFLKKDVPQILADGWRTK
jgi:hypothetical protein